MGRPAKPDGERVRDIAPTGVRLPSDMRDQLLRQAAINGRSLGQEITIRLRDSLAPQTAQQQAKSRATAVHTGESPAPFQNPQPTDSQRMLLALFDSLTPDRQLALLTLLAPVKR